MSDYSHNNFPVQQEQAPQPEEMLKEILSATAAVYTFGNRQYKPSLYVNSIWAGRHGEVNVYAPNNQASIGGYIELNVMSSDSSQADIAEAMDAIHSEHPHHVFGDTTPEVSIPPTEIRMATIQLGWEAGASKTKHPYERDNGKNFEEIYVHNAYIRWLAPWGSAELRWGNQLSGRTADSGKPEASIYIDNELQHQVSTTNPDHPAMELLLREAQSVLEALRASEVPDSLHDVAEVIDWDEYRPGLYSGPRRTGNLINR